MPRKTRDSGLDGLLVVDKPAGATSHDVVSRLRRVKSQPRAGHSGTLDPDATGVLLVGFGRVTKLLPYLVELGKSYRGDVVLGTETTTLDASGEVVAVHDMSAVSRADVEAVLPRFRGDIVQIPPMVSAVHVAGKRLYEYARDGIEVERPERRVRVLEIDVVAEPAPGVFTIVVRCSSGTYIRSLAADIGSALGGGAHLRNLRRTSVGPFTDAEAVPLDDVTAETPLLAPLQALRGRPVARLTASAAAGCIHGRLVRRLDLGIADDDPGPWVGVDPDGGYVAVLEAFGDGLLKPAAAVAVD